MESYRGANFPFAPLLCQLLFDLTKQPSDIVPEPEGAVETIGNISRRTFRDGEAYELIVFDRLSPDEQRLLTELRADPDFYGVLRPRPGTGRTIKAVGKGTALLWLTLQSPGPLPFFFFGNDCKDAVSAIPELLLDGVLEVEENGRFLTGAEAAQLMAKNRQSVSQGSRGRLALLSNAALRYGESLLLDDPSALAGRLYGFGRQPATPHWTRLLADGEAVLSFLGAGVGTDLRRRLDSDWQQTNDRKMTGWLVWFNRMRSKSEMGGGHCKLYVSPAITVMPQVFPVVLELASAQVRHFKIGSDAAGLLRPDKMVLYFPNQERLFAVASELASLLKGTAPHGVPFSAEITSDGLLSWGMDPPQAQKILAWQEPESWRLWLVRRLAAAMIAAQTDARSTIAPSQFALERLRHEGVDVDTWMPSASIWHSK